MDESLIRGLAAVVLLALVSLAVIAARAVAARERQRVLSAPPEPTLAAGRVTILYFHGDNCGDCLLQERELDRLLLAHPEVAIRADHAPSALSRRFRVMAVPTTVVLDATGRARAVNYRLATCERLEEQIGTVLAWTAQQPAKASSR